MSTSKEISETIKNEMASKILREMYEDSKTADVTFTFSSDGKNISANIPAHKCVLAQGSEVFYKMFFGELRESGDVNIDDVAAEAFKEFLQFFYCNEIKLTKEYVVQVLYLSKKYNLEEGTLKCEHFLEEILDSNTICWGYELALLYDLKKLTAFCERKIALDTQSIFKSDSFKACSRDVLKKILLMDHVSCTEIEIFNACMKWAEVAVCKENEPKHEKISIKELKSKLGDLLELIRFPTMTIKQLSACLENYDGMLTNDEVTDLKEHIIHGSKLEVSRKFNDKKRIWKLPEWFPGAVYCSRYEYGYDSDSDNDPVDRKIELFKEGWLIFVSTKKILLRGIATPKIASSEVDKSTFHNRSRAFRSHFRTRFEIWEKDQLIYTPYKLVLSHLEKLGSDIRNYIKFSEPVIINPLNHYEIRITFIDDVSDMYIYSNIQMEKPIVLLKHGVTIFFHYDDYSHRGTFDGTCHLISELIFQYF